jgi:hypothetical protein
MNKKSISLLLLIAFATLAAPPANSAPAVAADQKNTSDVLAPEKPALRGYVTSREVTGDAVIQKDNGTHVDISITNQGKRSLVVDALNGKVIKATEEILDRNHVLNPPNFKHQLTDFSYVTMSIASWGYWPMAEDEVERRFLRKDKQPAFYGLDQRRRDLGQKQFTKRTLLPGETGRGTLYLSGECPPDAAFSFPVTEYPSGENVGNLVVRVRSSGTASGAESSTLLPAEKVVPVQKVVPDQNVPVKNAEPSQNVVPVTSEPAKITEPNQNVVPLRGLPAEPVQNSLPAQNP